VNEAGLVVFAIGENECALVGGMVYGATLDIGLPGLPRLELRSILVLIVMLDMLQAWAQKESIGCEQGDEES